MRRYSKVNRFSLWGYIDRKIDDVHCSGTFIHSIHGKLLILPMCHWKVYTWRFTLIKENPDNIKDYRKIIYE